MTDVAGAATPAYAVQRRRIPTGLWIEPAPRWVRAYVQGVKVADSRRALLVWDSGPLPAYWFPEEDIALDRLTRDGAEWTLRVDDRVVEKAARSEPDASGERAQLAGHIAFSWNAIDAWFEEDDEVFVHPRDPYHRVDVLHSSRHIRVEVNGQTVADTQRPALFFETNLPTRYYIPKQDVRMDLLEPTDTHTSCPYKGTASYWSVRTGDGPVRDIVWGYPAPIPECSKVENLLSFYNEKVDIFVDGEKEERPVSPFS